MLYFKPHILHRLQYNTHMTSEQLKAGRLKAGLSQVQAAQRLGLSQPYLSQLEKGARPLTDEAAHAATALYGLPPTALPVPASSATDASLDPNKLARQLAGLGYPGLSHLRAMRANPAVVLVTALAQEDLDVRLAEALPWVLLRYPDLDWDWLLREARLHDLQNRLGFVVETARVLALSRSQFQSSLQHLDSALERLERSRLAREDTLCRKSMPAAERDWLSTNRSAAAKHWNLLSGLTPDDLSYAA